MVEINHVIRQLNNMLDPQIIDPNWEHRITIMLDRPGLLVNAAKLAELFSV